MNYIPTRPIGFPLSIRGVCQAYELILFVMSLPETQKLVIPQSHWIPVTYPSSQANNGFLLMVKAWLIKNKNSGKREKSSTSPRSRRAVMRINFHGTLIAFELGGGASLLLGMSSKHSIWNINCDATDT